jgi:hypothetical protein
MADGEHYLLDTVLRVPLQTAGFRYQRFHPFGLDRDHLYAWIEGAAWPSSPTVSTYRLRWPNSPGAGCLSGPIASGVGNAVNWRPPGEMRFDYVHILLDCVPRTRGADLVRYHLAQTVRPGTGRLLVSDYATDPAAGHPAAAETLRALGFRVAGQTSGGDRPGRPPAPTAWRTNVADGPGTS